MTNRRARARLGAGIFVAAALAAPAALAQAADEQPAALKSLVDCRRITDNQARLACYDAAVGAIDQAAAKGEIVVVDREQANKVRRQAFGFSLPSLSIFDRVLASGGDDNKAPAGQAAARQEPLDRLTATLKRAYIRGDGKWVFELEDGAIWVQTDNEPIRRGAKAGDTVEIRKAAIGSFFINVAGQRAVRGTRVK